MTTREIHDIVESCQYMLSFDYNGKHGNVDPYYIPENKTHEYLLYYDGSEQKENDINAVMNTPFISGKCLNEIADQLTNIRLE